MAVNKRISRQRAEALKTWLVRKGIEVSRITAIGNGSDGSLEAGKEASFVAWDIAHPAELSYWLGGSLSKQVIYQGKEVYCD